MEVDQHRTVFEAWSNRLGHGLEDIWEGGAVQGGRHIQ